MSKPVHEIKYGGVSVAVFERDSEKFGKTQSYALTKSYKKKDSEEWVNQTVYLNNTTDIINVIQACQELLSYKYKKETNPEP